MVWPLVEVQDKCFKLQEGDQACGSFVFLNDHENWQAAASIPTWVEDVGACVSYSIRLEPLPKAVFRKCPVICRACCLRQMSWDDRR